MRARVLLRSLVGASLVLRCSSIFALFDPDSPARYCTVFTHLVKSGGQSVKGQLKIGSELRGLPIPGHCKSGKSTALDTCRKIVQSSTIIVGSGELLRNHLRDEGRECEFFTMMRHPIDRAVSSFFYCHHGRPDKWCGNTEGQEQPMSERFSDFVSNSFRNTAYQALYRSFICPRGFHLCKPEHMVDHGPTDLSSPESWEALRKIKRILLSYNAVGINEQWRLSMELFDVRVKSPVERWDAEYTKNAGVQAPARAELTQWAHNSTEVHNLLSADLHIYGFATAIFQQQTAESLGTTWD